jgi:hypothetical protein
MSIRKVIYETDNGSFEEDLEAAPIEALLALALRGDKESEEALLSKLGINIEKMGQEILDKIVKDFENNKEFNEEVK